MSLAIVYSRASIGIDAPEVTIEVHLSGGLPSFQLVGLPETTVKEARDRVRSAIINANFDFPLRRLTVNLAPADLPKEGGRFDLPIALGILAASGQIPMTKLSEHEFVAELALSGELRPVSGVFSAAVAAKKRGRCLIVAEGNGAQVALIDREKHRSSSHLAKLCQYLCGQGELELNMLKNDHAHATGHHNSDNLDSDNIKTKQPVRDLQDIIGQQQGKRALEIAAAGGHNLLLLGPPGTGKTMLASRIIDLLPELDDKQALESASVRSLVEQQIDHSNWKKRPFRAPHHSSSMAALVGGGSIPKPGDISLAHHGVLFLDEMPEFDRKVLDAMREPLESGEIVISRVQAKTRFPAKFQLIGALNPSPTGHYDGDLSRSNPQTILRYLSRMSGPLLDRFDLSIEITLLPKGMLSKGVDRGETTALIKQRVLEARTRMIERAGVINNELSMSQFEKHCRLEHVDAQFLEDAIHKLGLSIRAYHRIIKVARTIADLAHSDDIKRDHLFEALGYRAMDRLLKRLVQLNNN